MFSKSNSKASAEPTAAKNAARNPAPERSAAPAVSTTRTAPIPTARVPTMISTDMVIEGAIRGDGDLIIEGEVRGQIAVTRLTIGRKGKVQGQIQVEHAEIHGHVTGDIEALSVRLHGNAHVAGDITHCDFSVESGAFFEGRSIQKSRPEPAQVIELKQPNREAVSED